MTKEEVLASVDLSKAREVAEIIEEYFGEHLVDYQEDAYIDNLCNVSDINELNDLVKTTPITILIRFPNVRVTNENGRYIDIKELYVKVDILNTGVIRGTFKMHRTEFTLDEWLSDYLHSHCDFCNNDIKFSSVCLGSGPLSHTIPRISTTYSPEIWGLFCYELSKYVTVESLAGIPYRHLENVNKGAQSDLSYKVCEHLNIYGKPKVIFTEFLKYYALNHRFKLAYSHNQFKVGESKVELWTDMSNAFIKWINKRILRGEVLGREYFSTDYIRKFIINGSIVYKERDSNTGTELARIQGTALFTFKGEVKRLHITGTPNGTNINYINLLRPDYIDYFVTRMLKVINYNYGNKKAITSGESSIYV